MKAKIIEQNCIACGRCELVCPFLEYYDNGIVKFIDIDDKEKTLQSFEITEYQKACRVCPTRALLMED